DTQNERNHRNKNCTIEKSRLFHKEQVLLPTIFTSYIPLLDRPATVNQRHNHTDHRQCKKRNCMGSMRFHRWAKCKRMIDARNNIIDSKSEKDYREDKSSIKKR